MSEVSLRVDALQSLIPCCVAGSGGIDHANGRLAGSDGAAYVLGSGFR